MHPDCGVKYCCYGEYRCLECKRDWNSNRAWLTDGQKCKTCNKFWIPFKVEPLYSFVCLTEDCGSQWKNKFVDVSLCSNCGNPGKRFETPRERHQYILAHKLEVVGYKETKSGHLSEHCQKCQKSENKDCRQREKAIEDGQKLRRDPVLEGREKLKKKHLVIQKETVRSPQPFIPAPPPAISAWAVKSEKKPKQEEVPTPRPLKQNTIQNQSKSFQTAPATAPTQSPTNTELRSIEQRRRINEASNYNNDNVQQYRATYYVRQRPASPPRAESSCALL